MLFLNFECTVWKSTNDRTDQNIWPTSAEETNPTDQMVRLWKSLQTCHKCTVLTSRIKHRNHQIQKGPNFWLKIHGTHHPFAPKIQAKGSKKVGTLDSFFMVTICHLSHLGSITWRPGRGSLTLSGKGWLQGKSYMQLTKNSQGEGLAINKVLSPSNYQRSPLPLTPANNSIYFSPFF